MKNKKILITAIFISIIGVLSLARNTYAADNASIMKKWVFTQYYSCIRDGYINDIITQKNNGLVANDVFKNSVDFFLPSYNFENTVSNGAIKCKDLFLGEVSGLSQGVLDYAGGDGKTVNWSRPGAATSFLEGLGYGQVDRSRDQKFIIIANDHQKYHQVRGFISDDGEKDLEAQSAIIKAEVGDDGTTTYSIEGTYVDFYSTISVEIKNRQLHLWIDTNRFGPYGCSAMYNNQEAFIDLKDNVSQFYNDVKSTLQNKTWGKHCYSSSSSGMMVNVDETWDTYTFDVDGSGIIDSTAASDFAYAEGSSRYDVSNTAIKDMSGMSISDLMLSNNELYTLYYYYLDKALPTGTQNRITCNPSSTTNLTPVNLKDQDGDIKTCYVNFNGVDPNSINVYTQDHTDLRYRQPYPYIKLITMQGVIDWFNSVDPSTLTDIDSINTSGDPDPNQVEDTCYNSGGAGAVAWIVCPILEWIQDASEDIYNTYVEPALEINPSLFSQNEDEGTRYAWGIFQGIANTLFIILILVVIFSQLTGVGIDNYGIKKILPKIIIVAILVNLSYLICLICVDLSNILGNAFQDLFGSLGVGADSVSISGGSVPVSGGSGGAITAVVILGVIGGVIVWRNPAILLTLLVSALGVLISIFFLFLLLSARQAAIIILTVLSPLAFVCYILPNTKKFFDRWLKIWEGLLLLFPICGLLIGGGDYASRLLLHALANGEQDLLGAFTAMLVGIAPIFFIPTVLRGSFAALGNLGATISGVGNRLRAGTTKGIRNSEGYKNAQKMGQDRRMRYKAGYSERKGGLTAIGRAKANFAGRLPGRIMGMNKRQAAYVEAAKKNAAIGEESGAVLAAETAAVDIAEYIKANPGATPKDYFWAQIADAGRDIRKLNSVVLAAEKRGIKKKDIAAGIRNAANSGALTFSNAQSQSNWMNSVLQDHGDIMSTDYELQEWARKGGVGVLGAYGAYAAANIDASDVDISDYSKMSGVSLAAMIKAGKVSASMAQQWLAANPNASADKKIMMGAVASGAVKGGFAASAEDFKSEAEALANGTTSTTHTISGGVAANRPGDTLSDLVDSWTSTAQVRAYVSQDPSSIKPGQRQKDPVDVKIQHGP